MAKKAKKVSWRTLARRAEKAASLSLPAARRLRAKSAELRRADRAAKSTKKALPAARRLPPAAVRAAKGWATRRANEIKKAVESGGLGALAASAPAQLTNINRDSESWRVVDRGAPGHGELVGGVFSQLADRLIKLARKKGGTDAIQNELAALAQTKHYEGCVETDKAATQRLIEVQQILADRVVCGFIAEVNHAMQLHRGLPPDQAWVMNTFLITKIVDALNKAGYRATGKT